MNLISLHRSALVLLATVAPLAAAASATTWYVSPCGNDSWAGVLQGCSAPLGPKRTI